MDRAAATKWPQLYDSAGSVRQAVLDDAYNIVITEQVLDDGSTSNPSSTSSGTGMLTLEFEYPFADAKKSLIKAEMCILVNYPAAVGGQTQDMFVVRTVADGTQNGEPYCKVSAEGRWYDLGAADAIVVTPAVNTVSAALTTILAGTGWTIGTISPSVSGGPARTFEIDTRATPLAAIRSLPGVFGGEIVFDTINRKVSLLAQRGSTTPSALYAHGNNTSDNTRVVDTSQLTTRLYPLGASGLDITTVNGGVGYLENYSWYDAQTPPWPHVVKAATSTNDTLTDPNLLKTWGQNQLAMLALPRVTYTVNPVLLVSDTVPGLGDVVRVWDKSIALNTNARIVKRTLNLTSPSASTLEINTSAFTLSSALPTGTPRGVPVPVANLDHLAPAAPTGIAVTAIDTIDGNGNHVEYPTFTWNAVTANSDGSLCVDLHHYEVQYRLGTNSWISAGNTSVTAMQGAPLPPVATFTVQVRAVDTSGNASPWTQFTGTTPGVPAPTLQPPSLPTLDVTTFPLTIRATWDGMAAGSVAYPSNFDHLEVHVSTVSGFTPSASTLVDTLKSPGVIPITGRTAGATYYVAFVAVDTAGFKSNPSGQASAVPTAVQDGQIASVSISKLLVGSLTADMTVSARIKTADTGARVELNSTGLQAYNASGVKTVSINSADGSATFTGSITGSTIVGSSLKTAASGKRIEIDSGSAFSDRIQYFTGDPDETQPFLQYIQVTPGSVAGQDRESVVFQPGQLNSLAYGTAGGIQIDGPTRDGTTDSGGVYLSGQYIRLYSWKDSAYNDFGQARLYQSQYLPAFSGWGNYGSGYQGQMARRGYDGNVTLSGLVLRTGAAFSPVAGTLYTFATLPSWAVPPYDHIFLVPAKSGTGIYVYVKSTGSLSLMWIGSTGTNQPSIDPAVNWWLSLDGLVYPT